MQYRKKVVPVTAMQLTKDTAREFEAFLSGITVCRQDEHVGGEIFGMHVAAITGNRFVRVGEYAVRTETDLVDVVTEAEFAECYEEIPEDAPVVTEDAPVVTEVAPAVTEADPAKVI